MTSWRPSWWRAFAIPSHPEPDSADVQVLADAQFGSASWLGEWCRGAAAEHARLQHHSAHGIRAAGGSSPNQFYRRTRRIGTALYATQEAVSHNSSVRFNSPPRSRSDVAVRGIVLPRRRVLPWPAVYCPVPSEILGGGARLVGLKWRGRVKVFFTQCGKETYSEAFAPIGKCESEHGV